MIIRLFVYEFAVSTPNRDTIVMFRSHFTKEDTFLEEMWARRYPDPEILSHADRWPMITVPKIEAKDVKSEQIAVTPFKKAAAR